MHHPFLYFCTCACVCSNVYWQMSSYDGRHVYAHTCAGMRLWPGMLLSHSLNCALSRVTSKPRGQSPWLKSLLVRMLQKFHLSTFWWVVIAGGPQHMPGFLHVFWRLTHWSSHLWASVFLIVKSRQPTLLYGILFFSCFPLIFHHLLSPSK